MRLTAYLTAYNNEDVHDGEIYAHTECVELAAGPAAMVDEVHELINAMELERIEWSSSPEHRGGDWLTLTGHNIGGYRQDCPEHADLTLHGSLAQLERFVAAWSR